MEKCRVLIVDDNQLVLRAVSRYLRLHGYEVEQASSVAEAMTQIARTQFEVVLTDLRLGDGSGLDVLDAIAERGSHTHAVMFSNESDVAAASERAKVTRWLSKAADSAAILAAMRDACSCRGAA
jgi:two-component system, response regulator RegA